MQGSLRVWREAAAVAVAGGYLVALDRQPIRLPGGPPLVLASRALADAIALEWTSRPPGKMIRPEDIMLTRLAATAEVRIAPDRKKLIAALSTFAETDLLCYRAAGPEALVRREAALWQPWLDWARSEFGAALRVTTGVMPVVQDAEALALLSRAVAGCDVPALAALAAIVPALGSLVLGLAVVRNEIGGQEAATLAFADEIFQAECWGEDEAAAARLREIAAEVAKAVQFLALARA